MKPSSAARPEPPRVLPVSAARTSDRLLAWIRIAIVGSAVVLLPFVEDRHGYHPTLAWALLVTGSAYSTFTLVRATRRRYTARASAVPRALLDAALVLAFMAATGGVDSPWMLAMVLGIAVRAPRYRPVELAAVTAAYVVGYVVMGLIVGQLATHGADVVIRITTIVLASSAAGVVAFERSKRLASRLDQLNTMEELAHVGSWEWSLASNDLTWSNELRRIFGLPLGERPSIEFFREAIHRDDRAGVFEIIERALGDHQPFHLDHRIVRVDGSIRFVHCRGIVILGANGRPASIAGSSQDVTEQKTLEAKLLLSDRLASIGTMASGIAHEINNPLAYVATNLEVIDRQVSGPSPAIDPLRLREALDAARHGSDRVREIVRSLKTFARTDEEALVPVELSRVVDLAARIVAAEVEPRARLVRQFEPAAPVLATSARLTQVFVNLFVNAAQAIERGEPERHEIAARIGTADDGRAFVEIRDTGVGISDDALDHIFDPFYTTKPSGVGTGLGLAICHRIVTDLGGEITVESKPGDGSTFRVTLPVTSAVVEAAAPQASAPPPPPPPPPPRPKRRRLLIVDDEARYARSLKLLLAEDYDVEMASDGSRAKALFTDGARFDVILCDLMMPKMSGMDLHAALDEVAPDQTRRMVFLTGGATNERARAFLARADVRHLAKPLELPELEAAIAEVTKDRPAPPGSR